MNSVIINTSDELKTFLKTYYDRISYNDYYKIMKGALNVHAIDKPADIEDCFNQIDNWLKSTEKPLFFK